MVQTASLEYLFNIRQLLVHIDCTSGDDSACARAETRLYLNASERRLFTAPCADDSHLLISVPGGVSVSLVLPLREDNIPLPQLTCIDNVIVLQFRNVSLAVDPLPVLATLPTAKELQSVEDFVCASCATPVFHNSSAIWKDLPHEHWLELIDCWSCHDNEFAPIAERALASGGVGDCTEHAGCTEHADRTEHAGCTEHAHAHAPPTYHQLNNSRSATILPPRGRIYVGKCDILIDRRDFVHTTCPTCALELATIINDTHVKIPRDAIVMTAQPSFSATPVTLLMHRILDAIDSHSTYGFCIAAPGETRLLIRVLNWRLLVLDAVDVWRPSFKVGYTTNIAGVDLAEYEPVKCTTRQFDYILHQLHASHTGPLFHSTVSIAGLPDLSLAHLSSQ